MAIKVVDRVREILSGGSWKSINELADLIYSHSDRSSYVATHRAIKTLEDREQVIRKEGSDGLRFSLLTDAPKPPEDGLFRAEVALWTKNLQTWWDESCGSVPHVYNHKSPLPSLQTGIRGEPLAEVCAWSVLWAHGELPHGDLWLLSEADNNARMMFFEGRDYVVQRIAEDELVDFYLSGAKEDDDLPSRIRELIGRARQRRVQYTSPWNFQTGRRAIGGTILAPRFRKGWGPRMIEHKLFKYGIEQVAKWSYSTINRLYQEELKSPSLLKECVTMGVSVNDLVKKSDDEIRELHTQLREQRVVNL